MSGYKVVLYANGDSLLANLKKGGFSGNVVPETMVLGSYHWKFINVLGPKAVTQWNGARTFLYLNTSGKEEVYKWGPDASYEISNRTLGDFILRNDVPCNFIIKYLY
jgi:hypothetical protein